MKAAIVIRLIHSRGFGFAVASLAVLCAFFYHLSGYCTPLTAQKGLALPSADLWLPTVDLDFAAGLAGSGVTVLILLLLNKIFNVFRSMSYLGVALFAAMQLATPDLFTQFYTGTVLAIVVPLCLMALFSCFRQPLAMRHVFVIFLLLSFFTATQYCFAFYIPVFLIGLGQMQIFSLRSVLAALMGTVTPWWLLLGFGIISPADITFPRVESVFTLIGQDDTMLLVLTLGVTVFAMLLCFVLNILKTIAYNARARAINGSFTLLALVTVVTAAVDYRNIISYIPLLNFSAAMEITHYFATHRGEKTFIPVIVLLAVYAAIFICQTII